MAGASLRKKLSRILGYKSSRMLVAPVSSGPTRSRLEGSTDDILMEAIEQRLTVSFRYKNKDGTTGRRHGNPHAIWIEDGVRWLHLYASPQSTSESGSLPGWRTYALSRISDVSAEVFIGDVSSQFALAPGWNPGWYSRVGSPVKLVT